MKTKHQIYTRTVNGDEYYIVKRFLTFPGENIPDILENVGMHKNLLNACRIAKLSNSEIEKLCPDIEQTEVYKPVHHKPAYTWLGALNPFRLFPSLKLSHL